MRSKKGNMGFMGPVVGVLSGLVMAAILFVIFGISATTSAKVQQDVRTSITTLDVVGNISRTNVYNVSTNGLDGQLATSAQSSNVGTIIGFGAIIFLLLAVVGGAMAYFQSRK